MGGNPKFPRGVPPNPLLFLIRAPSHPGAVVHACRGPFYLLPPGQMRGMNSSSISSHPPSQPGIIYFRGPPCPFAYYCRAHRILGAQLIYIAYHPTHARETCLTACLCMPSDLELVLHLDMQGMPCSCSSCNGGCYPR